MIAAPYTPGRSAMTSGASVAPSEKPAYTTGPGAARSPYRARTAAIALSARSARTHAGPHVSFFTQRQRTPLGHTTNACAPIAARHVSHASSARSPEPCTPTTMGLGSPPRSGAETQTSTSSSDHFSILGAASGSATGVAGAAATVAGARGGAGVSTEERGMPEQLVQVFVNLFTNACHALPETGGTLLVTSSMAPDGKRVLVTVEDNGHGIATEHLAQIFAPFFTTKVDGRGTGLGLSIVKNIMDNHSAEIRAEAGDSGGARFVLVFPAG